MSTGYESMSWRDLMDTYTFYIDFPKYQVKEPEQFAAVRAEYDKRFKEGHTS